MQGEPRLNSPAAQAVNSEKSALRSAPRRAGTGQDRSIGREIVHFLGPAGLSLFCHLLFIFMLTLTGWAVGGGGDAFNSEFTAQVVSQASSDGQAGSFHFPGRAMVDRADSREAGKGTGEEDESIEDLSSLLAKEKSLQMKPVEVGDAGLSTVAVEELGRGDIVGTGPSTNSDGTDGLSGSGLGDRDLAGGGPVGAMWGVGRGQQARSVVYVMDRSGSMSDTFTLLQRELMRSIGALDSEQLFNVIWFNQGQATEWSTRMRKATIENKRAAFEAIRRIVPEGSTEPIDAIRKSLGFRPDVMFLLSDGDFGEENEKIISMFKQRNRTRRTIVNTILFIYDTMGKGEHVLRSIAETNGGTFKHVTQDDVEQGS